MGRPSWTHPHTRAESPVMRFLSLLCLIGCRDKDAPPFGAADSGDQSDSGDGGTSIDEPEETTTTWPGGADWVAGAGAPFGWTATDYDDARWLPTTSPGMGACDRQFDPFLLKRAMEWWEVEGSQSMWSDGEEQAVALRRTFSIPDDVEMWDARITVLADDDFRLWVNGQLAATERDRLAGPDTQVDVTTLLVPGQNVIALQAEDTSPDGCRGVWLNAGMRYGVPDPKKEIPTDGPPSLSIVPDEDWRVYAPDALVWLEGWWSPEHEGPAWTKAAIAAPNGCGTSLNAAVGGTLEWWQDPATVAMWSADDSGEAWFWTEIDIDPKDQVSVAQLTVQADDDYELWVNGDNLVTDDDLLPGELATFDLTARLWPGANQVAIRAEDIDPSCRQVLVSVGVRTTPGISDGG
jgi:hypothetical protein